MTEPESEQVKLLREILKWTKFAGMNQVQSVLETTLNTPEKRLAYQLSDGSKGTIEVGKLSKLGSASKVSVLWREWRRKGLGDSVSVQGGDRFKRTFDLEDFGIEFPAVQSAPTQQTSASTPAADKAEPNQPLPVTVGTEGSSSA